MIMKKKALISAIAISTTVLTLSGCMSANDRVIRLLNEEDYDAVLELISKWKLNDRARENVVSGMREELNEVLAAYANDEADYDRVSNTISTIYQMDFSELDGDLGNASARFKKLQNSKTAYSNAVKAYESEKYTEAIRLFKQVVEDDCNYEDAVSKISDATEKYTKQVITEAKKSADNDNYQAAIDLLSEAKSVLPDSGEINSLLADYQRKDVMQKADALIQKEDYEQAITFIEKYKEDTKDSGEEISAYLEKTGKEYVSFILEKVKGLCNKKDYLSAIKMLENASLIVPSAEFDNMITKINDERPVYLSELKYQSAEQFEEIGDGEEVTDTLGNKYTTGNLFELQSHIYGWSSSENGHADYYLGYKYNKMRGTIAVDDVSSDHKCSIVIEGDGVVLYSLDLTRLTTPTPIEIDVSNVNNLTFRSGDISGEGNFLIILSDFLFEQ